MLCYSESHDATLASLSSRELGGVVELWRDESRAIARTPRVGAGIREQGCADGVSRVRIRTGRCGRRRSVPTIAAREDDAQRAYRGASESADATGSSILLLDYADRELALDERVVARNDRWIAVVPYWAAWPFETLVLPLAHRCGFDDLDARDRRRSRATPRAATAGLRSTVRRVVSVFDGMARSRSRPRHALAVARAHLSTAAAVGIVRKFMVGFEMLAEAQRDLSPEDAAARLRRLVRP